MKSCGSKIKFSWPNYFHPLLSQITFSRFPPNILDSFVNKEHTFYFSSWRKQIKIIYAALTLIHTNTCRYPKGLNIENM